MSNPKTKQVQRLDSIPLDQTYFTEEGYLVEGLGPRGSCFAALCVF